MVPVSVPADATGTAEIAIEADWLVCREACIPGFGTAEFVLPVRGEASPSSAAEIFRVARSGLPAQGLPSGVTASRNGALLTINADDGSKLAFYPHAEGVAPTAVLAQCASDSGGLAVDLVDAETPVLGLVRVEYRDGTAAVGWLRIDQKRPNEMTPDAAAAGAGVN